MEYDVTFENTNLVTINVNKKVNVELVQQCRSCDGVGPATVEVLQQ